MTKCFRPHRTPDYRNVVGTKAIEAIRSFLPRRQRLGRSFRSHQVKTRAIADLDDPAHERQRQPNMQVRSHSAAFAKLESLSWSSSLETQLKSSSLPFDLVPKEPAKTPTNYRERGPLPGCTYMSDTMRTCKYTHLATILHLRYQTEAVNCVFPLLSSAHGLPDSQNCMM